MLYYATKLGTGALPKVLSSGLQTFAVPEGGVYELDQLDELADAFATRRVARTHSERHELWDAPSLWVLLFGFLFVEWATRKRWRMA